MFYNSAPIYSVHFTIILKIITLFDLYSRHLLSDQTDPFNRSPLSMEQIIPNTELAGEIERWIKERKEGAKST